MSEAIALSEQLASFIYQLEDIIQLNSFESIVEQRDREMYVMLLFKEGKGGIIIGEKSYSLDKQKVFICSPDTEVKLMIDPNHVTDYYRIRFHALQTFDNHHFVSGKLSCPVELCINNFHFLIDMVDDIVKNFNSNHTWSFTKANISFQKMIVFLFHDAIQKQKPDVHKAIMLTQDYMDQNYKINITRKTLAEIVGISTDYYSRAFKKEIGKSPMEYLTDIRINKAKQLLISSDCKLSAVAHKVGFNDEFYFSRKFKEKTGCSPSVYIKKARYSNKIVSLKHLITGHLLALGIEPYAAVMSKAYPVTTRLQNTIAVGDFEPDVEKILTVKPDLIITRSHCENVKSPKDRILEQIAPTVSISFLNDWRELFRKIATITDREQEANHWLEDYDEKAAKVRSHVQSKIGDDTILVVGIGKGKMCVYGQRNVGAVLYGDLKLSCPVGVKDIDYFKEFPLIIYMNLTQTAFC